MADESDTQINLRFAKRWAFLGKLRDKFTPTSVVSIMVTAFSLGGAVAVYKSSYEEAVKSQQADHALLVQQANLIGKQTEALNQTNQRLSHLDGTLEGLDKRMMNLESWRNGEGVPVFSRKAKH